MGKNLNIGFNARPLSDPRMRGFARHTFELLKAMQAVEPSVRFTFFSDVPVAEVYLQELKNVDFLYSSLRPHLAWEQLELPWAARRSRVSVFHATGNLGLPRIIPGVPRILTLHDMIAIREVRKNFRLWNPATLKPALSFFASQNASLHADAIITVSAHSRNEILKDYPALDSRIHVIHNGVEERFSPGAADPAVLKKYGLNGRYLFYVGGFEERKNLALIPQALRVLAEKGIRGFEFILAGDSGSLLPGTREAFRRHPEARWLGYVSDADLISLYRGASAVVLPSRDEGFGLQVLEAMGCGTPVLLSNAASLPEVGGEAAAYFKPDDYRELARLIKRILSDSAWAQEHGQAGLKRAKKFSWKTAAERTLGIYRKYGKN